MGMPIYLVEMVANAWRRCLHAEASDTGSYYVSTVRVPINTSHTYQVVGYMRKVVSGLGRPYAGVAFYAADGTVIGDYQWLAWSGQNPGTSTVFSARTALFGAFGSTPFPTGAVAMAPVLCLNYGATVANAGTMDCSEVSINDYSGSGATISADPYFRDPTSWQLFYGLPATFRSVVTNGAFESQPLTLRYATAGYMTRPSDTPANAFYDGRVLQPAVLRQELPADFTGPVTASYGEVVLINRDGALGELAYHGLDGQALSVKLGDADAAYSTFRTVLQATMEQAVVDRERVRVRLRGPDARLQRPLLSVRYLGNNSLPNGLEGSADMAGRVKPALYGSCANISPPCVNSARYIYQVSSAAGGANTSSVLVAGVVLTAGATYSSQADMEANAPTAGQFRAWPAGGMFRLGTAPGGVVTCAATAADGLFSAWNVLWQLATDAGLAAAEIYQAKSYTWPAPPNTSSYWPSGQPQVGLWVDDTRTASDAMAPVAASVGAWFGFVRVNTTDIGAALVFKAEPFPPPNGGTGWTAAQRSQRGFDESQILGVQAMASPGEGRGVPVYKVDLGYRPNDAVLTPSMAPSLSAAALGYLSQPDLRVVAQFDDLLGKHSTALTLVRDTRIANSTDSAARYEAGRQLGLRWRPKLWFEVRVSLGAWTAQGSRDVYPVLGGYVYLKWPELRLINRDGATLAEGWFTVQAIELDWARNECRMTVRQATEEGE